MSSGTRVLPCYTNDDTDSFDLDLSNELLHEVQLLQYTPNPLIHLSIIVPLGQFSIPPSTTLIPRIAFPVVNFLLLSWLTPFNLLQFLLLIPPFALLGAISLLRELSYGVYVCRGGRLEFQSIGSERENLISFLDYTITVHIR